MSIEEDKKNAKITLDILEGLAVKDSQSIQETLESQRHFYNSVVAACDMALAAMEYCAKVDKSPKDDFTYDSIKMAKQRAEFLAEKCAFTLGEYAAQLLNNVADALKNAPEGEKDLNVN